MLARWPAVYPLNAPRRAASPRCRRAGTWRAPSGTSTRCFSRRATPRVTCTIPSSSKVRAPHVRAMAALPAPRATCRGHRRGAHRPYCAEPASTLSIPADYLARVREVHEVGGYGSLGYRTEWKEEEARKNILRTHTTAVSARMLYALANVSVGRESSESHGAPLRDAAAPARPRRSNLAVSSRPSTSPLTACSATRRWMRRTWRSFTRWRAWWQTTT